MTRRILVLGGGFAGLWSAAAAARALDAQGVSPAEVEVVLVNRTPDHSIRVRNYETDLAPTLVPLASVLDPIGVRLVVGAVDALDLDARTVTCSGADGARRLDYDRLVFALGSRLAPAPVPGLSEHGFSVDTTAEAARLQAHLDGLRAAAPGPGVGTVLVVGAGLTGVELAAELPARLAAVLAGSPVRPRVILADRRARIGADMGEGAIGVIARALDALAVETRPGLSIAAVDAGGAVLTGGGRIDAATVVWCGGMVAHPLTAAFPVERDPQGRLPVDDTLRVVGRGEFAAGDCAVLPIDGVHPSVMSCQHARPMGRFAGHNAACDLLGQPKLPLSIDWYSTILDLGPWGAVHTEGWDRHLVAEGPAAKRTKETINRVRIYPPQNGDRRAILDAAAPVLQRPPARVPVPG